jgi:hypothetical protein
MIPLLSALSQLSAPLGVWWNQDHFSFRPITPLMRLLQEAGVTILNNRGVALRNDLYLAGVDNFRTGYPDSFGGITINGVRDRYTPLCDQLLS